MEMNILNFDLAEFINQNPIVFYSAIGVFALLVLMIIILACVNSSKKRKNKLDQSHKEETNVVDETIEEPVVEVVTEPSETLVEEKKPVAKKTTKKKVKKEEVVEEEKPALEEPTPEAVVEEEAPVEEVKPVAKKRVKKEKTVEEKPALEVEVVEEEVEMAEKKVVVEEKKQRVVNGKYEVYTDGTSYFYTLKASNGEVLIKSEAYASKNSVLDAIEAIKRNVEVGTIAVREDKHGLYQFVLTAKNHRTLVMSANYATEKRAQSASESFKRFASTSPVVELTEIVESSKEEITPEYVDKKGGKLMVLSSDNGFYYVLKASNGEVLVTSDNYKTEASAQSAMARFQEAVANGKFFVEKDKRDNYQFKLFANGRLVCVGQIYASKSMAVASINSVCSFVKLATVVSE